MQKDRLTNATDADKQTTTNYIERVRHNLNEKKKHEYHGRHNHKCQEKRINRENIILRRIRINKKRRRRTIQKNINNINKNKNKKKSKKEEQQQHKHRIKRHE